MKKILFLVLAVFIASGVFAADNNVPAIKTHINKKRIFIGDRIRLTFDIPSVQKKEIELPKFKDSKIGDCEIKDSGPGWFDITSYSVGKHKVPSIEIKYREKGKSSWNTVKTEEVSFAVESVLPAGIRLYDIKDIKGPIYPFSFLRLLMWIILGFFVLFLIYLAFKIFKKRVPPKLAHEIAIEELEAARKQLASSGDAKEYYVNVSDAIRRYIEKRFSLRAPEMTTQEFLLSLGTSAGLSDEHKALLMGFLDACDLVKFAKHAPSSAEIESVFSTAKKFIEETKEKVQPK